METAIRDHYRNIRRVLLYVLALNWGVAIAKIAYGLLTSCSSMTADGFHSLSDGTSNVIGLIGIHFACQPKDKDHPYGHKKYETLFSIGIAAMLFLICFELIEGGLRRISNPITPRIDVKSFLIMAITVVVNFWVMRYENKKGRDFNSDILISDALHTRSDIFISVSVIITLISVKMGFAILDPIATLGISLFIAFSAIEIIKHSSRVLCDSVVIDEKKIIEIVLGVRGVKTCHKIRTRGRPDDIYVDLHVQVNPNMHIDDAHNISYMIEEAIKKAIPSVSDVVVHMEPKD